MSRSAGRERHIAVYLVTVSGDCGWTIEENDATWELPDYERLLPGVRRGPWIAPQLYWPKPAVPRRAVSSFSGHPAFEPTAQPGVAHILSKVGSELLPLGGEADVQYWAFHEDRLPLNAVVYTVGLGAVAVEDESDGCDPTNFERCGLRAFMRSHELRGIHFKRIWDSMEPVLYHRGWHLHDSLNKDLDPWGD